MQTLDKHVGMRISEADRNKVQEIALATDRKFSEVLRLGVRYYLKSLETNGK